MLTAITWERANLKFTFSENLEGKHVFLKSPKAEIELEKINNNEVVFNVTNIPQKFTVIRPGIYALLIDDTPVKPQSKLTKNLPLASKHFKYHHGKCSLLVDFSLTETSAINLNAEYMAVNFRYKHFYTFAEGKNFAEKLLIFMKLAAFRLVNLLYWIIRIVHQNRENNVLFLTESATELSTNLQAVYEAYGEKYNKEIFATNSSENKFPKNVEKYLQEIAQIAKADTVIVDNYVPILTHLNLAADTRLAQVWHAGVGFKSVGYARFGEQGSPHPTHSGHRKYTHVFVDKKELIPIYTEVFGLDPAKFYATGIPRLDQYLDPKVIDKELKNLYKTHSDFKDKTVILFAPTYRGEGQQDAHYDYDLIDFAQIYEFCEKNDAVFVIKDHPFIRNRADIPAVFKERIHECNTEDINVLIYVADIMITDYSSCAYEFSLMNRPLVFFRPDADIYETTRPLHTLDVFTGQQFNAATFDELIQTLKKLAKTTSPENRLQNIAKDRPQGSAAKKIVEILTADHGSMV